MREDTELVAVVLREDREELLGQWVASQAEAPGLRSDLIGAGELRAESERFLDALVAAVASDSADADVSEGAWAPVREQLSELSRTRATLGFSPTETATFIFGLKQPLFARLRARVADADALTGALLAASVLLDRLGLLTSEAYLR